MSHKDFERQDIEQNKLVAAASYFIFFLPLLICPSSDFAKFHCNQGLNLLILGFVTNILRFFPIIGGVIVWIINALILLTAIYGAACAWHGKTEKLPVIGAVQLIP